MWIGKFETSTDSSSICYTTPNQNNCDNENQNPRIKPNVVSLRFQSIKNQFKTSQKFNDVTAYGLTSNFDSHMMKNTEWGAVAYLSHSKYGKNGEIWINPSSTYITGCAGVNASANYSSGCQYNYTSLFGPEASTTGNVYGIYDMSGGAPENVMAAMYTSDNTKLNLSSSSFDLSINADAMAKYINKYAYGTNGEYQAAYNRRILGDATGEVRGWYSDYGYFIYSNYSWFHRGGHYEKRTSAGLFSFDVAVGNSTSIQTFRVAISSLKK